MIRKHENSVSWKAGTLSILVHAVLLGALLISFNWKAAHTVLNVTEVELWDKIPGKSVPKPIEIKPEPKPEPKVEEPKPEPPKPVVEEKPKPEEPKVDIELEKKKQELAEKERLLEQKKLEDKIKKEEAKKKLLAEMREEDLKEKAEAKKEKQDALKKLQQEALNDEKGESDKQASAASASLIGEYTEKIKAKIRGNVNKTLCGDGNPELRFEIGLLPTGELNGSPKLIKSSGNSACDEAVERAIIASEPLPLPSEPSAQAKFRNLNLKFRPNDN
jgi:colicin import membrane protein